MNAAGRKAVSLTSVFILLAFVFLFTTAYYAAVPLICFAVLLAVSAASGFLPGRRLEYTVESEGRSEKEKPLVFFVTVKNSGVLPVFSVSITVVLRNKFTEEERRERISTVSRQLVARLSSLRDNRPDKPIQKCSKSPEPCGFPGFFYSRNADFVSLILFGFERF